MPALTFPASILFVSSDPSFFGVLKGEKESALTEVTRIDFPLIEHGKIHKDHLVHALKSLEQRNIHLVLSDEVFLHHIADYGPDAQEKIEQSIKETVASVFSDEKDPLHIVTVDLAKTSKLQTVQISAMTKENLSIIQEAAVESKTTIENILPASFVVKAFVSVDPSLFVLRTPHSFLLTSHYIGVDFAQNISVEKEEELLSIIKKLKKERDHIQHVYVSADEKELSGLHAKLESVLPVQDIEMKQMSTDNDTPYFLEVLCLGVKEVIENDFPLPMFTLNEKVAVDSAAKNKVEKEVIEEEEEDDDEDMQIIAKIEKKEEVKPPKKEQVEHDETEDEDEEEDEKEKKSAPEKPQLAIEDTPVITPPTKAVVATAVPTPTPAVITSIPKPSVVITPPAPALITTVPLVASAPSKSPTVLVQPPVASIVKPSEPATVVSKPAVTETIIKRSEPKKEKNKGNILKYILLTLGVAVLISLIGGGVVISQQALQEKKTDLKTPVAETTATPAQQEPTATPKPTEAPVALGKLKVSVVNATSIAGKAGKVATAVKKAGVESVDAGNAKDTYSTGTFIMFSKPELSSAKKALEEATGLTFEEKDMSEKDNPGSTYDIVIVLGE